MRGGNTRVARDQTEKKRFGRGEILEYDGEHSREEEGPHVSSGNKITRLASPCINLFRIQARRGKGNGKERSLRVK